MNEIPREAIDVLAADLEAFTGDEAGEEIYRPEAEDMLRRIEEVWPHNPPQRDAASTTTCGTERAWAPSMGFTGRLRRDPLHVTS